MITTNETLLQRVKSMDSHDAWKEFFDAYWGPIIRYGRKLGLSDSQAEDVLQETMVNLMRIVPSFEYDADKGRFRNFLLTIVHRKALACLRRVKRNSNEPWDEAIHAQINSTAPFEAVTDVEAEQRWKEAIKDEVIENLRNDPRIEASTWAIFEAYVLKHQDASQVADQHGVKENSVYQIKNRLMRRIKAEVARRLIETGSDDDGAA